MLIPIIWGGYVVSFLAFIGLWLFFIGFCTPTPPGLDNTVVFAAPNRG
jgi:hypothetical protein